MKTIDLDLARKVLSVVDAGLVSGLGNAKPGEMCVEAAVCYALGEEHGDAPSCVAEPDRAFKIRLNDSPWSSPQARAKGLRRLSVMQLGTVGTDREAWTRKLAELTIRRVVPAALSEAAKRIPAHAAAFRAAADRCRREGTRESAQAAADAAASAASAASAARAAANAADAAAAAAAYAANAADAAYAAAYAAADAAADAYAERDRILTLSARCAEEAYERTGSPGVDLLKKIESAA